MTMIGGDPVIMLEAPLPATDRALKKAGMTIDDIDLFEVNEAFASVPMAWLKTTGADPARLNVNGGAIALGHPLGASGTKLMTTLVHALQAAQQALRPADHVRRRRHGQRDDRRAAVAKVECECSVVLASVGEGQAPDSISYSPSATPSRRKDDFMTHPSIHARTQPDKIAYQMAGTGKAITYRELDELSNQGAHLFRSLGLKAGDHIAFLIENRLAFMEICWAAQRSGLYYTAISRYLTQDEIAYIVKDCGAQASSSPRRNAPSRSRASSPRRPTRRCSS